MRTQPGPSKDIWNDSPLPRPVKVLKETSLLTPVLTPPLQAIADSGSAKVGVEVSRSTGSPSEVRATLPEPSSTTLKRPLARRPAPSTRCMSQSMPGSKARMLSPLTVMRSFWRSRTMILRLSCARNSSPVPLAAISLTPSPVTAFLKKRPRPPLLCSKRTSPWYATIDPSLAWIWSFSNRTLSIAEFCSVNRPSGVTSRNCCRFVSLTVLPPFPLDTKRPSRSFLEHPATRRDLVIRGEKHDLAASVRYSKYQNLAFEARDPLRRKIDHGDDLPAHESTRLIARRELGAGSPGPDLRTEVHHELDRRLACLRKRLGLDDRADPYIHLLEFFPAYLGQSGLPSRFG